MGVNCGASCAKWILFAFNIIFFLGGAAVLGVGIWLRVDSSSFMKFLTTVDPSGQTSDTANLFLGDNLYYIHVVAYILIGIGSFVFLVGFLGCCGACKEWRPLLVAYAVCLILVMCAEVGVGIAVGVNKEKFIGEIEKQLNKEIIANYSFVNSRRNPTEQNQIELIRTPMSDERLLATNVMNTLQLSIGCCGLRNGYEDLIKLPNGEKTPYGKTVSNQAPVFCCKFTVKDKLIVEDTNCIETRTARNSWQDKGCITAVEEFVQTYAPAVIGVAVGIGLLELVGVFFAFCLCCAIGDDRKYRHYH